MTGFTVLHSEINASVVSLLLGPGGDVRADLPIVSNPSGGAWLRHNACGARSEEVCCRPRAMQHPSKLDHHLPELRASFKIAISCADLLQREDAGNGRL